jgi:DNA modification methylase
MGFDEHELARLTQSNDGLTDPDAVPELPADPVAQAGDIWRLGRHRVICGDARSPDDVASVLDGRLINVAFTSPPYAQQRDYDADSGFRPIPPDRYVEWFAPAAANVARHLADDGSWFVNIKPNAEGLDTLLYVLDLVIAHVRSWGWHFATEFCWERNGVPKSVTQRFKNQFEPIYQFARGRWKMRPDNVRHESDNIPRTGGPGSGQTSWRNAQGKPGGVVNNTFGAVKKRRNGTSRFMSDVQGENHDFGEYIGPGMAYPGNRLPIFSSTMEALGHAAAFPVGLPEFFSKAYADPGDVIYDPFAGTGSTLMAAERTGCIGIAVEISPAYVDVTIQRWQDFTGEIATRERDGIPFNELKEKAA